MTSPATPDGPDDLLAQAVQLLAQQSRMLNLHIVQHEDIEEVPIRVKDAFAQAQHTQREEHRTALAEIVQQREEQRIEHDQTLRQALAQADSAFVQAQHTQQEEHRTALAEIVRQREEQRTEHDQTLKQATRQVADEREAQRTEYVSLLEQTVARLTQELDEALKANADSYQAALSVATDKLNAEHQRSNDAAFSSINLTWSKFSRILAGISVATATAAVAALVVALL